MKNFDVMKNAWDRMGQAERRKFAEQHKDNANFQQFAQEYHNNSAPNQARNQREDQRTQDHIKNSGMNTQGYNWNANNATDTSNPAPVENNQQNQTSPNGQNWWNSGQNNNSQQYGTEKQFDPNEQLDQSKFSVPTRDVQVKVGTAQQTGKPDYEIESDARDAEMIGNLNKYKVTNPEFFSDRDTFNKAFDYHKRKSDRQRALLDSYWKKQEDIKSISKYTNGKDIANGMQNGEITGEQLPYLKDHSPEAYQERQKQQEEKTKLMVVNMAPVPDVETTIDTWTRITDRLGIQAGDPHNIKAIWEQDMETAGANQTARMLQNTIDKMNTKQQQYEAVMSRFANAGADTAGGAAANTARIMKALMPITESYSQLAQLYNSQNNLYHTQMATANQHAQVLQAQAQEDQRIFNNKLEGLGFAMTVNSYRTPEQQAQLQLKTNQLNNEISLLHQSRQNDLNLYNQYQTSKMQKQLAYDSADLNVKDPKQLRSNLYNILTPYFTKYGDLIQRPQAQVVEDIINLAKKEGISVGEAMRKNFIEPLQGKSGYKMLMNREYGISNEPIKDTIGTYNGESVILSYDENGHIKINKPLMNQAVGPQAGTGMKGAGLRNNNPGNIKDTIFGNVIGKDNRGFAQFATPEDGFDALVEKVKYNQTNPNSRYYGKTIAQYFQIYAPSSDGNNPKGYAQDVANRCGVSVNTPISQVDTTKFAAAIAHHDSGYNYSTYGQFRNVGGGASYNTNRVKAYEEYIRTGTNPSSTALKSMGINLDTFYAEVQDYQSQTGYAPLSNDQISQVNQMINSFANNAQVKAFEEAYSQNMSLLSSINDASGPGDVSAVFNFMKTLDPSSVVRESEFEVAARSAGVANQWKNIFNRLLSGKILTPKQRADFGKLSKQFVLNKAKIYDVKYADLTRKLSLQGIPEAYRPTSMADEMREALGVKTYNMDFSSHTSLQNTSQYSSQQSTPPTKIGFDPKSVVSGWGL